jgi:hypothetical protein
LSVSALAQRFEIKDRHNDVAIVLNEVKLTRYSTYFKEDIPEFTGFMRNVSGADLLQAAIVGSLEKTDGTVIRFPVFPERDIPKDLAGPVGYAFSRPWPFSAGEIKSVRFVLERAQRNISRDGFHAKVTFIAKDEGCLKDYLAARSLEGIALRKAIKELIEYGCGFIPELPLGLEILRRKTIEKDATKIAVALVSLRDERALLPPGSIPAAGWVPIDELISGEILATEEIGTADH